MSNYEAELDSFLNFDQEFADIKPLPSLHHQSSSGQQTFAGPSYQYDSHRQQTGLPIGGLANTFAVNQANGLHFRHEINGFVMPTETLNIPLSNLDDFDFSQPQSLDMSDMDFDAESPSDLPPMFYPSGSQHMASTQQAPQRIYPGMHSQQAAQAKAQQEQKKQEMLREQQQKQIPGQFPLPSQTLRTSSEKDPHVEESISRLLSRMRQGSTASIGEDESTPSASGSGMPRLKKDEEDMDEDERLLASEEGKKLSSKERRQLRNKVSARAFRSRRKEYIGQLEGEVAVKVQEANDLRAQNRQLMEENTRLTDLTRMLLSSQAFSGFLQELSNSGNPLSSVPSQQVTQPQPAPAARKDVSTHDAKRQIQNQNQQMQVGMTLMPETTIDMSMLEAPVWNSIIPSNDFQVFSITELPEPPKLDLSSLFEKKSLMSTISKKDSPSLPQISTESIVSTPVKPSKIDEKVELDEQMFDLYFESGATQSSVLLEVPSTLSLHLSKAALASDILCTVSEAGVEHGSWEALEKSCAVMDNGFALLEAMVPRPN